MYRIVTALVMASVLLLGSCGDNGDDEDVAGFCDDVEEVDAELGESANPEARVAALSDIDPPSDIANDWETMVELMVEVSEASPDGEADDADVDAEDLETLEQLDERIEEFNVAFSRVERYLSTECDLST